MYRVGITGGIGSGKSTVAQIFAVLGIPVYFADIATRNLVNEDPAIITAITNAFGKDAYQNGTLNRKRIADIVFNDPDKLALLNSITHPATIQHAENWMSKQSAAYTLKEAALIFESGSAAQLDFVIGVYAPTHLRIKRVMDRDGITADEVRQRMSRQLDESIKMRLCDAVIQNDEQQFLTPQILRLHELLLERGR